ncbi:MAG: ribonuclease P protein component [Dehalococcoidales bacterium]|nr:ribonuclease P protein component [Dehalococcoidales bacterium]
MRGEQYITKPKQYSAIYNQGSSWVNKIIVLKALPNNLEMSRYGFSVSSRVGGAVVRNRIKRRLREIIRPIKLQSGWDLVIIARPAAAGTEYKVLENSVGNLLIKAKLISTETKKQEIS